MISKFYPLLIIVLTSLASALAQVPPDDGQIQFRTLGWQVKPDDLYYESKGKDIKLKVNDSSRSNFQNHPKSKLIVFYRLVPGPEGKLLHEEACTADISAAGPWPLLVFMKDNESPKRYRVAVISDDLKTFPIASCRFINLTTREIYVKQGEQGLKVPARGMELIKIKLNPEVESEVLYTTLYAMLETGPILLYTNNWVMQPTQRTLVFIFQQDKSLKVLRIVDDRYQYSRPTPL